jgi:hypothetical protein
MVVSAAASLQFDSEGRAWLEWSTSEPAVLLDPHVAQDIASQGALTCEPTEGVSPDIRARLQASGRQRVSGYHAATKDHPFLDMSRGMAARVEDARIMAGYVEADEYPDVYLDLPCLSMHPLERASDLGLDALRNSDLHQLAAILAGVFGQTHRQPPYYDPDTGYHQVELIYRSVPSGGARHPTECFVEVLRSPRFISGNYYFDTRSNALVRVNDQSPSGTDAEELASDADWVLDLRLAPVVRRAMFRYRDPRSFRALLVDAGHADGQLHALAAFCNWRYSSATDIDLQYTVDRYGMGAAEAPVLIRGRLEGWL